MKKTTHVKYVGDRPAVFHRGMTFPKDRPVEVDVELAEILKIKPDWVGVRGRPSGNSKRVEKQGTEETEGSA